MINIKTEWVTLSPQSNQSMAVFIARPSEAITPLGGLIVLQEAFGVNAHIQEVSQRLAQEGYWVMAPELYHRTAATHFTLPYDQLIEAKPHMQAVTPDTLSADINSVIAYFQQQPNVKRDCLGVIGFCMGGKAAFIANSQFPFKAAIAYYGGEIDKHLDLAAMQQAPLLLYWGGQDHYISSKQREKIKEALYQSNKTFTATEFSTADHGFFCDARKNYHSVAAQQSWSLTLTFLKNYLV